MKPLKNIILTCFSAILLVTTITYATSLIFGSSSTYAQIYTIVKMEQPLTIVKFDWASYINDIDFRRSYAWQQITTRFSNTEFQNATYLFTIGWNADYGIILNVLGFIFRAILGIVNFLVYIVNTLFAVWKLLTLCVTLYPLQLLGIRTTGNAWWLAEWYETMMGAWIPYIHFK